MKKITSLALALFMVVSMLAVSFTSASAAVGIDFNQTGTITLTKEDSEHKPVDRATFTAYKVFDLVQNSGTTESTDEGTFKVTDDFKNANLDAIKLPSTVASGNQSSQGYLFTDTDELEKIIPELVNTSKNSQNGHVFTCKNDGTGTYTRDNLSLGIYLVVETAVPEVDAQNPNKGYVTSTASFLVTVPFWDADNEDNDNETGWDYTVNAKPKDDTVTVDKVIDNGIDNNDLDSFNIGEKVPYKVTSKIPDYGLSTLSPKKEEATENNPVKKLTSAIKDDQFNAIKYEYTDTFSEGLTFNYNSVNDFKVYLNSDNTKVLTPATDESSTLKTRVGDTIVGDADYKLTKTNNGFTLTVAWAALDAYQGDKLVLEYSATLNEKAVVGDKNDNTIQLEYTNNPETGSTTPIEDDADVVTYELHLDKKFNNKSAAEQFGANSTAATAVTFRIATSATAGSDANKPNEGYLPVKQTQVPTDDGAALEKVPGSYYVWDTADNDYATASDVYDMNVDASGALVLKGLKDGTYYLEETKTVSGFGKLKNKVKIEVSENTSDPDKIVDCNAQSYGGKNESDEKAPVIALPKYDNLTGTFVVTINNTKNQFNLPQTGGLGLWIFTIVGGVVMAGAIIFFTVIGKKKRNQ